MKLVKKLKKLFKYLGPGFITGAADDDPTAIGFLAKGEFASDSLLWYNRRNET